MTGPARLRTAVRTVAPTTDPSLQDEIAHRLRRFPALTDSQIAALVLTLDPDVVDAVSDAVLANMISGVLPSLPLNPNGGMPLGLPGAIMGARFVGGTASGPPTSGTFQARDFVIDGTGAIYVCTVAGTPGTWAQAGGGTSAPDASTSTKGLVKLAGDLAGTAAAPTVPGLAAKADTSAMTTALAGKQTLAAFTSVKTANYTAAAGDIIRCDTTSGTFTVTLPNIATNSYVRVKWRVGTAPPTVAAGSGASLDSTWPGFGAVGDSADFAYDGSAWNYL